MKKKFVNRFLIVLMPSVFFLLTNCKAQNTSLSLKSKDNLNQISLSLSEDGQLSYKVTRHDKAVILDSPLGLTFENDDFTTGLSVVNVSPIEEKREKYELKVANNKIADHVFKTKSITFKNKQGALMTIDLIAGEEGVAFRYKFDNKANGSKILKNELTGFHIDQKAKGWLQPYNKAGDYTPGYEDFYVNVKSGDPISGARNESIGWCMPALFNVNDAKNWVLIAESGTDGSFPGCHLAPDSKNGMYTIAFAKNDEKFTLPLPDKGNAYPESAEPWTMPWRVIMIGDNAGNILLSTMITDLAPASKIKDVSWIQSGKAAWSWWSHPEDFTPEMYNKFTDVSASFGFKYTLFDAGWEKANKEGKIVDYALSKGVQPLVWGFSAEYFDSEKRKRDLKNWLKWE
nr:glycoside hydrolase family 97 N-terminal domain-containing protein [Flavobacterium ginsengisoli]